MNYNREYISSRISNSNEKKHAARQQRRWVDKKIKNGLYDDIVEKPREILKVWIEK
jgi:hypothetical protein